MLSKEQVIAEFKATGAPSAYVDAVKAVYDHAFQAGAEAEREACACICDVRADNGDDSAYLLANEIRERGTT